MSLPPRQGLLIATIAAFAIFLAVALGLLVKEIRTMERSLRVGSWRAVQIEVEFQRFLNALDRYGLGDEATTREELIQRLDILWSRLELVEQTRANHDPRDDLVPAATTNELRAALTASEPIIRDLAKNARERYRRVRAALAPLAPKLHGAVQAVIGSADAIAEQRQFRLGLIYIAVSFLGVMVSGGVLTLMLIRARWSAHKLAASEAEARRIAERASRAKSAFLANMSHELRTPLNAVIGFSELMREEPFGPLGSPRYREYLDDIREGGAHLLGVINTVLDISKVESGEIEIEEAEVEVPAVLSDALRMVRERAAKKGVDLAVEIDGALPKLRADARVLRQIVLNLVANAVKFTDPGGSVAVGAGLDEIGRMVIRVRDNGIGIAPSDLSRVMQPFVQADSRLGRKYEGVGLGLPLAKAFAEVHGGHLSLDSALGQGTTATVIFPRERTVSVSRDTNRRGSAC